MPRVAPWRAPRACPTLLTPSARRRTSSPGTESKPPRPVAARRSAVSGHRPVQRYGQLHLGAAAGGAVDPGGTAHLSHPAAYRAGQPGAAHHALRVETPAVVDDADP